MKTIDITEHKALNHAKRIFNNSIYDLVPKLKEEVEELIDEVESVRFDELKVKDELSDVAYVLCQLMDRFDTNYKECLQYAIRKIEKRDVDGRIKLIKQLRQ